MMSVLDCTQAGLAFLRNLIGRRDPLVRINAHGTSQLQGWERIPEDSLFTTQKPSSLSKQRWALYCISGNHLGECFFIDKELTTIGCDACSDIVLTPDAGQTPALYHVSLKENLMIHAQAPSCFELNGTREYRSSLVDYDELSLMGSIFLVLDTQRGAA